MKKTLVILILAVIALSWNFIFSDGKKLELTDPAKILRGLSLAQKYKSAVRQFWQEQQHFPSNEEWQNYKSKVDVDVSHTLVKTISVGEGEPGAINVTFINKNDINVPYAIDNKSITLVPTISNDKLIWECYGELEIEIMPKACKKKM